MKANENNRLVLSTPTAFNFDECLRFLDRSSLECLHRIEGRYVYRLLEIKDDLILVSMGCDQPNQMQIAILNKTVDAGAQKSIHKFVEDWFDLDRDLTPFYRLSDRDPLLKKLAERHYGLRIIGIPDFWEALCWSIIGQQINLQFAYTLKKRMVEAFGEKIVYEGNVYWAFPKTERIAALDPDDLKLLQFSRQKAQYAIEIAQQICAGNISKEKLQSIENIEDKRNALIKLRGVGAWTADYVLMKCLRESSAFPIADVGLHNAIKLQLNLPQKPSLNEIQIMAQRWKGWEAYATFYLWRSLYE